MSGNNALLEKIKDWYFRLENKYYEFVETLAERGVPVDRVVGAIESRGVPSFPIVATLVLILILGPIIWAGTTFIQPTYKIQVLGPDGTPYHGTIYLDGKPFVPNADGYVTVHFKPSSVKIPEKGITVTVSPDMDMIRLSAETHTLKVRVVNQDGEEIDDAVIKVYGKNGTKTVRGSPAYFKLAYADSVKDAVVVYDDGHVERRRHKNNSIEEKGSAKRCDHHSNEPEGERIHQAVPQRVLRTGRRGDHKRWERAHNRNTLRNVPGTGDRVPG